MKVPDADPVDRRGHGGTGAEKQDLRQQASILGGREHRPIRQILQPDVVPEQDEDEPVQKHAQHVGHVPARDAALPPVGRDPDRRVRRSHAVPPRGRAVRPRPF